MSSISKPQQRCSYSKVKESNRSADGAVSLLNSKSDETVDTQISVVHDTDQQKVRSFRQLDKCTTAQPVATATSSKIDSSVTSSDVWCTEQSPAFDIEAAKKLWRPQK